MRVKETQYSNIKAVHPRPVRHHGLFGNSFIKQHMLVDEHWTPDCLIHEFKNMTLLLTKHSQFIRLDKKVQLKELRKNYQALQKQCRDGRSRLKVLRAGSMREVRNTLKDHRDMQRLYQQMPLHLVDENINHRTFLLRKERDRLESRRQQLEQVYKDKVIEKADLENRISYENEFRLEEADRIETLQKNLEQSKVRLRAIMTINSTYKKIVQILRHDEIFHVPILRSLDADVEDQAQFIKHILHLGSPALDRFKELRAQYKLLDDKVRKSSQKRIKECSRYRKLFSKPHHKETKDNQDTYYRANRYVRETTSMLDLQEHFEEVEQTIKRIQIATTCSDENAIYSRIKSQVKNNLKLGAYLEENTMGHKVLGTKMKFASVLQGSLLNNYSKDELMRLERVKKLKEDIKHEDDLQANTLLLLKGHANTFVVLRYFLWNLHDIMIHVGSRQMPHFDYPVEYLKLPLLKYEMLSMKVCPPILFETNISKLFKEVQEKVLRLTKDFNWRLGEKIMSSLRESYCNDMLSGADADAQSGHSGAQYKIDAEPEVDLSEESKSNRTILSRNQIKFQSARLVDEHLKKDD